MKYMYISSRCFLDSYKYLIEGYYRVLEIDALRRNLMPMNSEPTSEPVPADSVRFWFHGGSQYAIATSAIQWSPRVFISSVQLLLARETLDRSPASHCFTVASTRCISKTIRKRSTRTTRCWKYVQVSEATDEAVIRSTIC